MKQWQFNSLVFLIYLTNVYGADFKNSIYPFIKTSLNFTMREITQIQSMQTIAIGICKPIIGLGVDYFGARASLLLALFTVALGLMNITISTGFWTVALSFVVVEVFAGFAWPALTVLIGNWYRNDEKNMDAAVWILSLSSRFSSITTLFVYPGLHHIMNWKHVNYLAAFVPGVIGVLLVYSGIRDTPDGSKYLKGEPPNWEYLKRTLLRYFKAKEFWAMVVTHCCSAVFRKLDMLLGIFFTEVTGLKDDEAPVLVAVLPTGIVCGILFAGSCYTSTEHPQTKLLILNILNALAVCSIFMLIIILINFEISKWRTIFLGTCIFNAAFGISVQYYIVSSVFALKFGVESAGFCIAVLDGLSYCFHAVISILIGEILESGAGWSAIWTLVTLILIIGWIDLNYFYRVFFLSENEGMRHQRISSDDEESWLGISREQAVRSAFDDGLGLRREIELSNIDSFTRN